jgi:hypothetical protein
MQRDVILERHAFLGSPVSECSVAIVVVKEISVPHSGRTYTGIADEQVKEPVVVVIPPRGSPSTLPGGGDTGFFGHIRKGAIAVIPVERVRD